MVIVDPEHPRVCGENDPMDIWHTREAGTSPRMRGKLSPCHKKPRDFRNIPAYAGKTTVAVWGGGLREEHPRVCGENKMSIFVAM